MKSIVESMRKIEQKAKSIELSVEDLASIIDHTKLSAYETENSLSELCKEAKKYGFHSVCVNPYYTKFCANQLEGENIAIDTVVGFPLGQNTTEEKVLETKEALKNGASEIDMVMNIGAFRDEKYKLVKDEIKSVAKTAGSNTLKVIIETSYLTYEEITQASKLVKEAGANFVKNATGFGPYGANIPHLHLMREAVGEDFGVKAAGGIHNSRDALRMISAGVDRIGSSAGVEIIESHNEVGTGNWEIEEDLCSFCPSQMVSEGELPKSVFRYYKSKCDNCSYES